MVKGARSHMADCSLNLSVGGLENMQGVHECMHPKFPQGGEMEKG